MFIFFKNLRQGFGLQKEFLLLDAPQSLESALGESFDFRAEGERDYLVSNRVGAALIYAPEIDWFLANSKSDEGARAKIVEILYEARAIAYDRAVMDHKITYDEEACQYCGKIGDSCGLCVLACPQKAIVKDETTHRLKYADDLCLACGKCVGACPTGALELGAMGADTFCAIARLYEGLIPLLIDEKALETLACPLPAGVAPLITPNGGFLNETSLLTLLQESGSQIVAANVESLDERALALINGVCEATYDAKAVLAIDKIDEARPIAKSRYSPSLDNASARARFAARLRAAVGDRDLGVVPSERFGAIAVDESACTLCASCAAGCVTGAIAADETEGILRATDALCTMCGECESVCPEKAISLNAEGLRLNAARFQPRIVAKD
ncbi:MAG: 4Fe-4S binding protein, partial [Helicobacteraceae bacterium]|nr:4Fe-4S binding protein [Helicobacteraceae bacterium]